MSSEFAEYLPEGHWEELEQAQSGINDLLWQIGEYHADACQGTVHLQNLYRIGLLAAQVRCSEAYLAFLMRGTWFVWKAAFAWMNWRVTV